MTKFTPMMTASNC